MMSLFKNYAPKENQANLEAEKKEYDYNEVDIREMPPKFRFQNVIKEKTGYGIYILTGGILLLLAFAVIFYVMVINKNILGQNDTPDMNNEEPKQPAEEKKEEEKVVIKTPKERFNEASQELPAVVDFDEYKQFLSKYASQAKIGKFENLSADLDGLSASEKGAALNELKKAFPKSGDIDTIAEDIAGSNALLEIKLFSGQTGSIQMALENNEWKLDQENWKDLATSSDLKLLIEDIVRLRTAATSTVENPDNTATTTDPIVDIGDNPEPKPGLDTDGDGLTDKEESILGTDINNPDTDGDGYTDGTEINNSYNPKGQGKASDMREMIRYQSQTRNYQIIYPASWTRKNLDGDDSVLFQAADSQFFQVLIQTNDTSADIDEWYQTNFNQPVLGGQDRITGSGWEGIKGQTSQLFYLTDNQKRYIVTLAYNNQDGDIYDYPTLFLLFVKSLVISG